MCQLQVPETDFIAWCYRIMVWIGVGITMIIIQEELRLFMSRWPK